MDPIIANHILELARPSRTIEEIRALSKIFLGSLMYRNSQSIATILMEHLPVFDPSSNIITGNRRKWDVSQIHLDITSGASRNAWRHVLDQLYAVGGASGKTSSESAVEGESGVEGVDPSIVHMVVTLEMAASAFCNGSPEAASYLPDLAKNIEKLLAYIHQDSQQKRSSRICNIIMNSFKLGVENGIVWQRGSHFAFQTQRSGSSYTDQNVVSRQEAASQKSLPQPPMSTILRTRLDNSKKQSNIHGIAGDSSGPHEDKGQSGVVPPVVVSEYFDLTVSTCLCHTSL